MSIFSLHQPCIFGDNANSISVLAPMIYKLCIIMFRNTSQKLRFYVPFSLKEIQNGNRAGYGEKSVGVQFQKAYGRGFIDKGQSFSVMH